MTPVVVKATWDKPSSRRNSLSCLSTMSPCIRIARSAGSDKQVEQHSCVTPPAAAAHSSSPKGFSSASNRRSSTSPSSPLFAFLLTKITRKLLWSEQRKKSQITWLQDLGLQKNSITMLMRNTTSANRQADLQACALENIALSNSEFSQMWNVFKKPETSCHWKRALGRTKVHSQQLASLYITGYKSIMAMLEVLKFWFTSLALYCLMQTPFRQTQPPIHFQSLLAIRYCFHLPVRLKNPYSAA